MGTSTYKYLEQEYTIKIEGQPYHFLLTIWFDGSMRLRLYHRREVSVKVKPEDVNVDMGPFSFQLEPYARVLCARLELEK